MIAGEVLVEFSLAAVLLALAPGPDNLFVVTHSAVHGVRAGWLVTLGLCTGLAGHTLVVAAGLAATLAARPGLLASIRIAGAAYLLWLASQAWRAALSDPARSATADDGEPDDRRPEATLATADDVPLPTDVPRSARGLYVRGIVMNLTNPKVALFFAAFLPQFVRADAGAPALQVAMLGGLFLVATLLVFGSLAAAAGTLAAPLLQSARARRVMNGAAGCVFALLALSLAIGH